MARQSFLSGGFIGKLGDVVGQRWKNKKIVRRYVVGANPDTELQKQNRATFATATRLAQQAMNINGHTGAWDNSLVPEFSQRVGQAMRKLKEGATEQEALPLYPDGYIQVVPVALTGVSFSDANYTVTLSLSGFGDYAVATVQNEISLPSFWNGSRFTSVSVPSTLLDTALTLDFSSYTAHYQELKKGIASINLSFLDNNSVVINALQFTRGFAIQGILYDFDALSPVIETQGQTSFNSSVQLGELIGDFITQSQGAFYCDGQFYAKSQDAQENGFTGLVVSTSSSNINFTVELPGLDGTLIQATTTSYFVPVKANTLSPLYKDTTTFTPSVEYSLSQVQKDTSNTSIAIIFDGYLPNFVQNLTITLATLDPSNGSFISEVMTVSSGLANEYLLTPSNPSIMQNIVKTSFFAIMVTPNLFNGDTWGRFSHKANYWRQGELLEVSLPPVLKGSSIGIYPEEELTDGDLYFEIIQEYETPGFPFGGFADLLFENEDTDTLSFSGIFGSDTGDSARLSLGVAPGTLTYEVQSGKVYFALENDGARRIYFAVIG